MTHPALLFLLWALWLGAEYFVFGSNSYVRIHDNADARLPAYLALSSSLKSGTFGYWSSQWADGADHFAQNLTNDLTALPFLVLPGWLAYAAVIVLQRFIAGYFTFRLFLEELNLRRGAAIYAGLAFALFSQNALNRDWAGFTLYSGFALPGTALLLWLLSRLDRLSLPRAIALSVLTGGVLAASASIVMTLFVVVLVAFWFWFVTPSRALRFWSLLFLFAAIWALISFLLIWPGLVVGPFSNRAQSNVEPIWSTLSRVVGGVDLALENLVPLLFGLVGLMFLKRRDRRLVATVAALVFCFAMGTFYYTVAGHLRSRLGFLYGFNWERFNLLIPFLALTAAALAISQLPDWRLELSGPGAQRSIRLTTLLLCVACLLTFAQSLLVKARTLPAMLEGKSYYSLFRNPALEPVVAAFAAEPHGFRVATISLGNTDPPWPPGAVWAYGLDSADGYLNLQSHRYQELWEDVIAPLTARDKERYEWVHSWGNQLYLFAPTNGFPQIDANTVAPVDFAKYYRLNLLTLAGVRYIISPVELTDPDLVLVPTPALEQQLTWLRRGRIRRLLGMLVQRAPGMPLYVYENRQRLPRAFCASSVRVFGTDQEMLDALAQTPVQGLGTTAMIDAKDAGAIPEVNGRGASGAVSTLESADRIELAVDAPSPCVLTLTESYSPYWKGTLDGTAAAVIPVDHAFQGVVVPAGRHRVTLHYVPPYARP